MLNKKIFILTLFISFFFVLNLNSQKKVTSKKADPFTTLKESLIKDITTIDKIYDCTENYQLDQTKTELLLEAWVNSNDNTQHKWIELNQFKYQENKELYKKIRETEYYIFCLPTKLKDSFYDFENKKYVLYPNTDFFIYFAHPSRRDMPLDFHYKDKINIPVTIAEAKTLSEDGAVCMVLLVKQNGWGTVTVDKNAISMDAGKPVPVIDMTVVRVILVNGDKNKIYKNF